MRSPDRMRSLRKIVQAREAQAAAARLRSQALWAARHRLQQTEAEASVELERHQQAWSQAMGASRVDLPLAAAWSRLLLADQADLNALGRHIHEKDAEIERGRMVYVTASLRADVARDLLSEGTARARRRAEERRLNETADRFSHWGEPSW